MPAGRDSATDYATLFIHRRFDCHFSDLWEAVTSPKRLSVWFTSCGREPDGRYSLRFTDSGDSYIKYATILGCHRHEAAGEYRFVLQDEGYSDSTVEVRVLAVARAGCALTLRHLRPPPELAGDYARGWADYLNALRRHLAAPFPDLAASRT